MTAAGAPLILLSAALAALALPPWNLHPLAWIALVPFFLALRNSSTRGALAAGLLWGVAHHWATAYWVLPAMTEYYKQPWWFAFAFGVVTSVVFRGSFGALFAVAANRCGRGATPLARATLFAAAWTAVDLLRVHGPTEDPWLLFGYALMPYEHLVQVADATGVYGLTFLVVFVNGAVAEVVAAAIAMRRAGAANPPCSPSFEKGGTIQARAWSNPGCGASPFFKGGLRGISRRRLTSRVGRLALLTTLLLAATYAYGAYRLAAPLPDSTPVAVAVVQGNNDMAAQWQPELHGRTADDYLRLSAKMDADVLIWPESAVTFFLAHEDAHRRRIERFAKASRTELIIGAPHYEGGGGETRFYNSAFHVSADGIVDGRYDKVRLLPFAEYFPLRFGNFLRRSFGRVRTFTPGADTTVLDTGLGMTAVAICFEAVFPDLIRKRMAAGAEVLVNLSNDIWLGDGAGPRQHFAMVPLRAIENRSWVIRSTTTGISAVVDPFGRVREMTPMGAAATLSAGVVPLRVDTLYEAWGDSFGGISLLIVFFGLAFSRRRATVRCQGLHPWLMGAAPTGAATSPAPEGRYSEARGAAPGPGSSPRRGLPIAIALATVATALPRAAVASCDQIPGAVDSFRGSVGRVDRPFAGPGDFVRIEPASDCTEPTEFLATPAEHVVTIAFKPPNGPSNLVFLATDCSAATAACGEQAATCVVVNDQPGGGAIEMADGSLRFRFPDTDALLPPDGDGRTFTGPAAIAVTAASAPLPCELVSKDCAEIDGTLACIDRLYAATSTCGDETHELFPSFTALPAANDFRSLCTTIGSECTGSADEVRLTIDAGGNLLLPMDWSGILLGERVPFARLVRASSSVEAFPGSGEPIRLPSENFLQSVSLSGGLLPALFEPQLDPGAASELSLFGAADAPRTVLRFARRGSSRMSCSGGANDARPCIDDGDCGGGTCGESACADDAGRSCREDSDCSAECGPSYFDFSTRFFAGTGPILVARGGPGVCEDDGSRCTSDADCARSLCVGYRLSTEDPVLIDGVFETDTLRISVTPEGIAARDLNGDGDLDDEVVLISDRESGERLPIGVGTVGQRPPGRAGTIIRQGPFRDPALALSGDIVAFLEAEPLQWGRDLNGDGDQADSFLRVFRRDHELTAGEILNADAAPLIDGKPIVLAGDRLLFRSQERADARTEIVRVSSSASGNAANGASRAANLSRDGRWVAFQSAATDLVLNPAGDGERVFIHDLRSGATTQVVPRLEELIDPNGSVDSPWLSGDGRHLALVAPGVNGLRQVWTYDRDTDVDGIFDEPGATSTNFGSISQHGLRPAEGESIFPTLNVDGRMLAFVGRASDLRLAGDDRIWITYWHDRDPDMNGIFTEPGKYSTNLASEVPGGHEPNLHSVFQPAPISDNANAYAYASYARDIVEGDTNEFCLNLFPDDQSSGNCSDVFLFSYWGRTQRVSVGNQGQQGNQASLTPAMSADGGLVAFLSFANNLVAGDTNGVADVFLRDIRKRSTARVSVAPSGEEADASSFGASLSISADGRYVAYASSAGNLVAGDDNFVCDNDLDERGGENCFDVFVYDRFSGFTKRVSATSAALDGNERSTRPSISADGGIVAFQSRASNLVDGDDNRFCDNDRDGENDDNCTDVFLARPHPADIETADLTGDGDLDDTVLRVFDISSGETQTLCPAQQVVSAGDLVVFLRPESSGAAAGCPAGEELGDGVDLNGDGDAEDLVVHRWRPGAAPENLRLAASAIAASERWIAALRPDPLVARGRVFGEDNGPVRHLLIHAAEGAAGDWIDLDQPADVVQVVGDLIAFSFPENTYSPDFRDPPAENDLTGNGRLLPPDRVPFLYDASAQRRISFRNPILQEQLLSVSDFVLGRRLFAFVAEEAAQGGHATLLNCDFNRDGECDDLTLFVYDIERDVLHDTRQSIVPCPIELCDPSQPFVVLDHTVRFLTLESEQGEDLNGDGDLDDLVVQTFDIDAVPPPAADGGAGGGEPFDSRSGLRVIGPIEAGVCTSTRAACVDSSDCSGGECHVPPGRCALATSIACDPVSSTDQCGADGFCVPRLAGMGACQIKQGACFDDSDCGAAARCADRGGDARRFLDPLRNRGGDGHVFSSAGECVEDLGASCSGGTGDCPNGATCAAFQSGSADGMCRRFLGPCADDADCPRSAFCRPSLVVTSATDSDGDEVPDAFDNCDNDENPDQRDTDGDGIGDVCQRKTAIEGPDGGSSSGDGCAIQKPNGGSFVALMIAVAGLMLSLRRAARSSAPQGRHSPARGEAPGSGVRRGLSILTVMLSVIAAVQPLAGQDTACPGDCGRDGRVTASDLVLVTQVAMGMADVAACSPVDVDVNGEVDAAELDAAVDAIFTPCRTLSPVEALSLALATIRATERAGLGLLSGFQFVNGAAEDAPPGSEPGACPQGGSQRRGCEILDDTFVRIPFSMDMCSYLGDDALVTADGGFGLIGTGSCPGLFVLSGSRLELDLDVATGFVPAVDTYRIGLRGVIDEITLASGSCSLSHIAVPFRGAIDSELSNGALLGVHLEGGIMEADFGKQPCRPTSLRFVFDGPGGVYDSATAPFASFDAGFKELDIAIDVEPRLATSVEVTGMLAPGCSSEPLTLSTPEPLSWRNGCATGGSLRVTTESAVVTAVFSSDGSGVVDGEAEATIDGCGGIVPLACGG